MSDFAKAREAAIAALHGCVTFYSPAMTPEEEQQEAGRALDAALSAFEEAGFPLVPSDASKEMCAAAEELDIYWGYRGEGLGAPADVYRVMIAARPK